MTTVKVKPGTAPVLTRQIGDLRLDVVRDREFRLDGGAMFGVVPRSVWERLSPPDAANRIRLQTNCLLVRGGDSVVLVDTGIGDKGDPRFRERFQVTEGTGLLASLERLGVEPADVTHVINSHLHWDHAGWNTRREPDGGIVPTFPEATYVVQRGEWDEARAPTERTRASYRPDDFLSLETTGQLRLVEGAAEVVPGVTVVHLPGHNRSMQGVRVQSCGDTAIYLADLIPTRHHLPLPFIMGYDVFPAETLETKRRLLPEIVDGGWLVIFDHDPELPMAYLHLDEAGRPVAVAPDERG